MLFEQKRKRVTQKGLWVTLKRLSSKDWTHPNPLHPLLSYFITFPRFASDIAEYIPPYLSAYHSVRGISLPPVAVTS